MREQTKTALEHGNGKRIPCGVCGGLSKNLNVTCERCSSKGTVLYPVRYFADRLTA